MSVTLRLENMLETSVRPLLIFECQKAARGSARRPGSGSRIRRRRARPEAAAAGAGIPPVVLEVGVLDDGEISAGLLDGGADGAPLPWFTAWRNSRMEGAGRPGG